MLMTDIHVRAFTGSGLKPYLHSIAKLRMEVFKDYPYFENPDLNQELQYLRKISSSKESIAVLIFDNTTLVGVSLGSPLEIEDPALHRPFKERNLNSAAYFYFGDSALLKGYRGRGIGHHFFDQREGHVTKLKRYKHICFCSVLRPEDDERIPSDYLPLDDFWKKRGYVKHPEMLALLSWKDIGRNKPSVKPLVFWIKNLPTRKG